MPDVIDTKRTKMTTPEDDKGQRGPKFDGTGDYMEWKRKITLLQYDWIEDGLSQTKQIRRVLGLLSGPPFMTATDGGDLSSCIEITSSGGQIVKRGITQIFALLEERLAEAVTKDQAATKLFILQQGKRSLEEYAAEFDKYSAIAGTPASQKPLLFHAGLNWGIKKQLGAGFLPEKLTYAELWRSASLAAAEAGREERRKERDNTRGRGRGGGRTKGRGAQAKTGDGDSEGRETRKCFYCDKPGHLKADCNTRKRDEKDGTAGSAGKQKRGGGAARGRKAREASQEDVDVNLDDSDED